MNVKARVLIVGTVPYNPKMTSRAFESYFCNWERENLAQVFSNKQEPVKGHCSTLYQITDKQLLKKRLRKNTEIGKIYSYDELKTNESVNTVHNVDDSENIIISKLYSIGAKKRPILYLMRKYIWKKKFWCSEKFNKWLDEFQPECVFLSFSDDFFIPEIALYVAEKFNIPIVSSIGDDYYFNTKFSISPFYYIYKSKYKALIRKIFSHDGSAIYIGDKIRDKYNEEFKLNGKTVYLTSDIEGREFKEINTDLPVISYFGNIGGGRNESLNDIGKALSKVNCNYKLHIYSNEKNKNMYKMFFKNPNIEFHGSIPYSEVQKKMLKSDILVIVEGFKPKDIYMTRYSLSTKVADSLASGAAIFAYGSPECGAIEYAKSIDCVEVCTEKSKIADGITHLIGDKEFQKNNYNKAKKLTQERHNIEKSSEIFERLVKEVVHKYVEE